jgi:hypothetical protein
LRRVHDDARSGAFEEEAMKDSIYKSPEGEAEILALYDEALAELGPGHESFMLATRYGETHVLTIGPEDAPPAVFLPGGNFLNPTCLRWFGSLGEQNRVYAPDLVGQPGKSVQDRPSPKSDGHAWWVGDVLDGLGLRRVPLVGLSYGGGHRDKGHGLRPRARLAGGAGLARGRGRGVDPTDAR